jgi:hypothetical protein
MLRQSSKWNLYVTLEYVFISYNMEFSYCIADVAGYGIFDGEAGTQALVSGGAPPTWSTCGMNGTFMNSSYFM